MNTSPFRRVSLISPMCRSKRLLRVVSVLVATAFLNLQAGGLIGFAVGSASAAEGAGARKLAVKVYPKTAGDEALAKAVYVVLRGGADRLAQQGFQRATGMPPAAAQALARAWQNVDKGRALLKENKIADAFAAFTEAENSARAYMGYADRALVGHIYKGLGIGFIAASKPAQAKRAIKLSLFAYPNQTKSEYSYSKEFENFILSAQREIMDSPKGMMEVETSPEGAEVYVDFEFKGYSPVTVQNLVVGEHIVTFMADGYEPLSQLVDITGGPAEYAMGELIELDNAGAVQKASDELGAAIGTQSVGPKAGQYATLVGATDLLAVSFGASGDNFLVNGVYMSNGQVSVGIPRDSDVMAEVESIFGKTMNQMPPKVAVLAPLEPDMVQAVKEVASEEEEFAPDGSLLIDPNSPLFKDPNAKKKDGIEKKWWFWTALVLGLGAIGGLTYWGVTAGGEQGGGTGNGSVLINLGGIK